MRAVTTLLLMSTPVAAAHTAPHPPRYATVLLALAAVDLVTAPFFVLYVPPESLSNRAPRCGMVAICSSHECAIGMGASWYGAATTEHATMQAAQDHAKLAAPNVHGCPGECYDLQMGVPYLLAAQPCADAAPTAGPSVTKESGWKDETHEDVIQRTRRVKQMQRLCLKPKKPDPSHDASSSEDDSPTAPATPEWRRRFAGDGCGRRRHSSFLDACRAANQLQERHGPRGDRRQTSLLAPLRNHGEGDLRRRFCRSNALGHDILGTVYKRYTYFIRDQLLNQPGMVAVTYDPRCICNAWAHPGMECNCGITVPVPLTAEELWDGWPGARAFFASCAKEPAWPAPLVAPPAHSDAAPELDPAAADADAPTHDAAPADPAAPDDHHTHDTVSATAAPGSPHVTMTAREALALGDRQGDSRLVFYDGSSGRQDRGNPHVRGQRRDKCCPGLMLFTCNCGALLDRDSVNRAASQAGRQSYADGDGCRQCSETPRARTAAAIEERAAAVDEGRALLLRRPELRTSTTAILVSTAEARAAAARARDSLRRPGQPAKHPPKPPGSEDDL